LVAAMTTRLCHFAHRRDGERERRRASALALTSRPKGKGVIRAGDPPSRMPMSMQGTGSIWVMNADGSNRREILAQAKAGVQPVGSLDWGVSAP
jgi:hypothetical protein